MSVTNHSAQLERAADDIADLIQHSFGYGVLRAINYLLFLIEVSTLLAAIFHIAHGEAGLVFLELAFALGVLVLHTVSLMFERRMHHLHGSRADRLRDELRGKALSLKNDTIQEGIELRRFRNFEGWG